MFSKPVKDKRLITIKSMPIFEGSVKRVEKFESNAAGKVLVIWGNPSEEIILEEVKKWNAPLADDPEH